MDVAALRTKAESLVKKYKYVAIVLLVGVVLMLLPTSKAKNKDSLVVSERSADTQPADEALAQILCKIKGAGKVQVLLTVAEGEETVYQTDDNFSVSGESNSTKKETVTVTDADRNQNGLIKQVNPPVYLGAIVVCDGADSASVRLAIVDAVSKVTGLSYDQISVLKMK